LDGGKADASREPAAMIRPGECRLQKVGCGKRFFRVVFLRRKTTTLPRSDNSSLHQPSFDSHEAELSTKDMTHIFPACIHAESSLLTLGKASDQL
jgi:hypothetical protein